MKVEDIQFKELFNHALPAIESKRNEFHLYGYTTVTNKDIWSFCLQKKWRKREIASMRIHEIVNSILQLTPSEYMTYTQIEEQRASDWFSDLNSEELQLLLSPRKIEDS